MKRISLDSSKDTRSPPQRPRRRSSFSRPTPEPTPQVIVTEPEEETGGDTGSYALIGVAALVFIAGAYYFKVYKPRHEEGEYDDEGMEFDDSEDETDDGE